MWLQAKEAHQIAPALTLAVARFKERWPQIQLDYDPILLPPKSVLPRLGYSTAR